MGESTRHIQVTTVLHFCTWFSELYYLWLNPLQNGFSSSAVSLSLSFFWHFLRFFCFCVNILAFSPCPAESQAAWWIFELVLHWSTRVLMDRVLIGCLEKQPFLVEEVYLRIHCVAWYRSLIRVKEEIVVGKSDFSLEPISLLNKQHIVPIFSWRQWDYRLASTLFYGMLSKNQQNQNKTKQKQASKQKPISFPGYTE